MISGFELLEDYEPFEDDREVIYPGKRPVAGLVHTLVVTDDEDEMYVVHMHDCLGQYGEPACDIAWSEHSEGLEMYFHRAEGEGDERTDGLIPGEYLVQAWSTEWHAWTGEVEYDSGIALLYPEEAQ
ncbi:hypothetical protein [Streptomyces sp. H34-S4]|uniref:hypothetical protein n=1 Tax=Streptomyces sp. H34-S4 TaxID=2996463 RepID=UPI00226F8C57|nr:hypothetical protein [Streptomyces sp. H34-S4]MCY0933602.1 hypothetical protein [Streptomyces sp. H34-S4]